MFNRDFAAGVIGLALAIVYYALAANIQTSQLSDEVGPDGLPRIYGWLMGGLSLLLILRSLALRPVASAGTNPSQDLHAACRAAGVLAIAVAYVVAVPFLGYPLAITAVIAAAALYQGGRISLPLMLVAIGGAAVLWFLFVYLLHIAQPAGLWPDLIESIRR